MKINLVSFNPLAADTADNSARVLDLLRAPAPQADIWVLPEAALCGCPLFDLFDDKRLLAQNLAALKEIAKETKETAVVLGYMDKQNGAPATAAAFIYKGKITKIFDTETVSYKGKRLQLVLGTPDQIDRLIRQSLQALVSFIIQYKSHCFQPFRHICILEYSAVVLALTFSCGNSEILNAMACLHPL